MRCKRRRRRLALEPKTFDDTGDMWVPLTQLGIDRSAAVGHDIGTMVAYACTYTYTYAGRYQDKTERLMVTEI